jgi:type I restriction enzyme S subunit
MSILSIDLLPNGWYLANLADLGQFVSGAGFPEKYQNKKGLPYPFFKVGNLATVNSGKKLTQSEHTIDEAIAKELRAKIVPIDSIAFAKIGMAIRLNRRRLIGVPSCIDNNMMVIIPSEFVLPSYLLRFLETIDFMPLTQATTVPSLPKSALEGLDIPLPPLNEQRRIVAKLEVLLNKVDACQKRLEKIPRILKRFRQAVLAAACDGRLTADWREKHSTVEHTFKILTDFQEQNTNKAKIDKAGFLDDLEIPDKWEIVNIRSICTNSFYGPRFGRNEYVEDGIPTIRTTDMTDNGSIILKDPPKVQVPKNRLKDFQVIKNDLLITRTGSIGVMAIFKGDYVAIPSAYLIRFRFLPQIITDYVFYFLKSICGQNMLGLNSTAVTQPNINAEVIKDLPFPLPPLPEQQEIVRRVESLFKLADQLEARYQKAKAYVDKLTQSILAKAFRGELVPQDPNDEPASVLLERIKKEKEAAEIGIGKPRKANVRSKQIYKKEIIEEKEIVLENQIPINEKFVEITEEKISDGFSDMVIEAEKMGLQLALPFMEVDE